jgi:hypothetical protein
MIWKDFVIQIKAGILPGEVIIVDHSYILWPNLDLTKIHTVNMLEIFAPANRRLPRPAKGCRR